MPTRMEKPKSIPTVWDRRIMRRLCQSDMDYEQETVCKPLFEIYRWIDLRQYEDENYRENCRYEDRAKESSNARVEVFERDDQTWMNRR